MPHSLPYPMPYLIEAPKLGDATVGYISVMQDSDKRLPFEVKRSFWTYHTPDYILRGRHAHHHTQQVLFALSGKILVTIETAQQEIQTFKLESPNIGLYLPPFVWRTMQYQDAAVQLVLASTMYDEHDYIRSHEEFCRIWAID